MGDWNYANILERIAAAIPDAPAQVMGDRVFTWAEWHRRANGVAQHLIDAGLTHQSKVAAYLYNCPEYFETYLAAFKAGMTPVNTNYRYADDEIVYLFDNADAEAVVFHAEFAPLITRVKDRLPQVKAWIVVDDPPAAGSHGNEAPSFATPYETAAALGTDVHVQGPWGRSGDDLLLLYTGGTTGMPKGVMWRQDDLFQVLGGGGNPLIGVPAATSLDELASRITGPGSVMMPACPMMHGTGQFSCFVNQAGGGSLVCLDNRSFSAERIFDTIEAQKVNALVIVGDAFARPLLAALEDNPNRWDLSPLFVMSSSGVMWSQETKDGLMKAHPQLICFDSLGSSEAVGLASSTSAGGAASGTAAFKIGDRVKVLMEDGTPVAAGSDDIGMVSIAGYIPVGYYKDEAKSALTFKTFDGVRYSTPGDFAQVLEDGSIHLLGRGSVCINTGGEKVFPEEVEEVLKTHGDVVDAVCVGLPDDRFGEAICAVVELEPGHDLDEASVIEHVKARLARYKAPKRVVVIDTIGRAANGKVDYTRLKAYALDQLE